MIGAIIGAVASIGAAVIGSKSQKQSADKAADAQIDVARENNALAREFRAENTANFAPYTASGTRANSLIDSFLYGQQAAAPPPQATVQPAPTVADPQYAFDPSLEDLHIGSTVGPYTAFSPRGVRNLERFRLNPAFSNLIAPTVQTPQAPQSPVTSPPPNALSGYQQFEASPYYQFPLAEGRRGLDHALAASGRLDSGDAFKRAIRYGQDYGYGRMGEYIGLAERQANRGVTGASAIAGVSQNALSSMTANNQNAADAMSNAALLRGQANAQLWGGVGNAIGVLASSYGKGF